MSVHEPELSLSQYRMLFANMTEGFALGEMVLDAKGEPVDIRILKANDAFYQHTGLPRDILGDSMRKRLPQVAQGWMAHYGSVARTSEPICFEDYNANTGRHYELHSYCPEPGHFAVLFRDITAQKQAEAALRASEAELRTTFEQAGVGIAHISAEGFYLRANPKFCEIVGFSEEELRRMHTEDLSYPLDRRIGLEEMQRVRSARAGKNRQFVFEKRYCRKSGRVVWVRVTGSPVLDPKTKKGRYSIVIVEDITEARETKAELEGFFRQAAVGVILTDADGRIHRVNNRICHILGYSEAELAKMHYQDLIYPDDAPASAEMFRKMLSGEVPDFTVENRYRRKDGRYVWASVAVALIQDTAAGQAYAAAVIQDIHDRKYHDEKRLEAREELEARVEQRTQELQFSMEQTKEALREAEAANRAKNEFLATMSHEIRTPLNGVIGFIGLLLDGALTEEKRRYVELAEQSGQSLLHLLNDFLDFSKIEAGCLELEPMEFDLHVEVKQIVALMQPSAREKNVDLKADIVDVPRRLCGDATRLRQILLNLLSNAVKFTPQGHVTLCCKETSRRGAMVRICLQVIDTGIGIDPATRAHLFQPFVQAGSIRRRFGGTGLGLAISRRLTEAMGGKIGFHSRLGEGTTFWVELPFERLEEGSPLPNNHPDTLEAVPEGVWRGRVLVAEDNSVSQLLAAEVLKRLGCQVNVVGDGQEAVEAYRQLPYDLIVMDCDMPVMDGLEATRAIRALEAEGKHVPIVAMTASALQGDLERCLDAGMDDFMSKPVRMGHLSKIVATWLRPA